MAHGKISLTYYDYGGEPSVVTVPVAEQDETTLAAFDAQVDTFKGFLEALMVSPGTPSQIRAYSVTSEPVDSASALNQRETKLLVVMQTNTSKATRRLEVPGFDLTKLNPSSKGTVDITSGAGADLKNSIESIYQDPLTGEGVEVLEMRHVGRNT
jgi:hypothetical protein